MAPNTPPPPSTADDVEIRVLGFLVGGFLGGVPCAPGRGEWGDRVLGRAGDRPPAPRCRDLVSAGRAVTCNPRL